MKTFKTFKKSITESAPLWKATFTQDGRPSIDVFVNHQTEKSAKRLAWEQFIELKNNSTKVAHLYDMNIKKVKSMFESDKADKADRMDKKTSAKLDGMLNIMTTDRTQSLWYSPNTQYPIHSVDDGYYSKKPGIYTMVGKDKKFIPLSDINLYERK